MGERLRAGQQVPTFAATAHDGTPIDLERIVVDKRVWIAFFRYAQCPMCNLRLHELSLAWPRMKTDDVEMLAVFQSPPRSVLRWVTHKRPPLRLVPDPEMRLYDRFGLERSWTGLLAPGMTPRAMAAARSGISLKLGPLEGPFNQMPADFLIERGGQIVEAHYGRTLIDHLSLAKVSRFLNDDDQGTFIEDSGSLPVP